MNLTKEEKYELANKATIMMQAYGTMLVAKSRVDILNNMSKSVLGIDPPVGMGEDAIEPFIGEFKEQQEKFWESIGITEGDSEFWEYCQQKDAEMKARQESETAIEKSE